MRALMIRPGAAVGDAVWVSAMPRMIKEQGFDDVRLAIMEHNEDVYFNNPYVDKIEFLPHHSHEKYVERIREISEGVDKVFGVSGHVEVKMLFRTDAQWGDIPSGPERRVLAEGVCYQDRIYEELGFETKGVLPEIYLSQEEERQIERILELKAQRREKLVLWNWEGSSKSKELVMAPYYLREVLKKVPNSMHYIWTPTKNMQAQIPLNEPRAVNMWGKSTIRNSILLCKAADLVIGPESFLVNAAGAFDTPKMVFFSHSAPENLIKYYKNAFAVVPDVACHPCYLIHVDFRHTWHPHRRALARTYEQNCQTFDPQCAWRLTGYKCTVNLPHKDVVDTIVKILKNGPKAAAKKNIRRG